MFKWWNLLHLVINRSSRPEVFCKKGVLSNFTGKHLCQSLFFNKVAALSPATLLKKRPWQRCFTVNFTNFLRTPLFINHLWDRIRVICNHLLKNSCCKFRRVHKKTSKPECILRMVVNMTISIFERTVTIDYFSHNVNRVFKGEVSVSIYKNDQENDSF